MAKVKIIFILIFALHFKTLAQIPVEVVDFAEERSRKNLTTQLCSD